MNRTVLAVGIMTTWSSVALAAAPASLSLQEVALAPAATTADAPSAGTIAAFSGVAPSVADPDFVQAIGPLRDAARSGAHQATQLLALTMVRRGYYLGRQSPEGQQALVEARRLLENAAGGPTSDPETYYQLGLLKITGLGGETQLAQGFDYLRAAAEAGHGGAAMWMADRYAGNKAERHFLYIAARAGVPAARVRLAILDGAIPESRLALGLNSRTITESTGDADDTTQLPAPSSVASAEPVVADATGSTVALPDTLTPETTTFVVEEVSVTTDTSEVGSTIASNVLPSNRPLVTDSGDVAGGALAATRGQYSTAPGPLLDNLSHVPSPLEQRATNLLALEAVAMAGPSVLVLQQQLDQARNEVSRLQSELESLRAKNGTPSQEDLARWNEEGIEAVLQGDYELAAQRFRAAMQYGHASAIGNLGMMYLNSTGVPRDLRQAGALFERAARAGNVVAAENLGRGYEFGLLGQDRSRAIKWYEQAAQMGSTQAVEALARLK